MAAIEQVTASSRRTSMFRDVPVCNDFDTGLFLVSRDIIFAAALSQR
jgi:hypothetical protein